MLLLLKLHSNVTFLLTIHNLQGSYDLGIREGPETSPWDIKGTMHGI